jgi:predicted ATP-grasp superfamily ATP-dependent carboligase
MWMIRRLMAERSVLVNVEISPNGVIVSPKGSLIIGCVFRDFPAAVTIKESS